jgi:hypothetical protein
MPQKPPERVDKKPAFLAAFVKSANLTAAAKKVRMDRGTHYDWLREDPEYVKAYAQARIQAGDTLKDIAVEWSCKGVFEPLVYQGRFQYKQRPVLDENGEPLRNSLTRELITEDYGPKLGIYRRSEGLHARLLKAFLPDEFADRGAVEVTGANGGPVENSITVTLVRPDRG